MDIGQVKIDMLRLSQELKAKAIRPDVVILFGSVARGADGPRSDIDIAVVSRDFGKSRFDESKTLNLLLNAINPSYEGVPIPLSQYLDPDAPSPILNEIKSTGIVLF